MDTFDKTRLAPIPAASVSVQMGESEASGASGASGVSEASSELSEPPELPPESPPEPSTSKRLRKPRPSTRTFHRWTHGEERRLLRLVDTHGKRWNEIVDAFNSHAHPSRGNKHGSYRLVRTPEQLRVHWRRITAEGTRKAEVDLDKSDTETEEDIFDFAPRKYRKDVERSLLLRYIRSHMPKHSNW